MDDPEILRRYTDIPALFYLLNRKVITLLDPVSWEDTNDSYYLALYKQHKRLGSLLALCFTQAGESYHHWRAFAHGPGGICIEFKRDALMTIFTGRSDTRAESVKYLTLEEIRSIPPTAEQLPFVKRYGYAHENEFRIIHESPYDGAASMDVPIPLSAIVQVVLSPWIPTTLWIELRKMLNALPGCSKLQIRHSTLIANDEWKRLGEKAAQSSSGTPAA